MLYASMFTLKQKHLIDYFIDTLKYVGKSIHFYLLIWATNQNKMFSCNHFCSIFVKVIEINGHPFAIKT